MSIGVEILVLVAFGILSGVLGGLLGVGGGVFMVPFLVLVFAATQQEAQASSLVVILPTALAATTVLWRAKVMDIRKALGLGAVGALAAVVGASLALALPADTLKIIFALFLGVIGLRIAARAYREGSAEGSG